MKKGLPSHIQKALRAAALLAVPGRQEPLKKKVFRKQREKRWNNVGFMFCFPFFANKNRAF
jgi:hypothetical protein